MPPFITLGASTHFESEWNMIAKLPSAEKEAFVLRMDGYDMSVSKLVVSQKKKLFLTGLPDLGRVDGIFIEISTNHTLHKGLVECVGVDC